MARGSCDALEIVLTSLLGLLAASVIAGQSATTVLTPGYYRGSDSHFYYVGIEHELPDAADNQTYDPATNRITETSSLPHMKPIKTVSEARSVIETPEGLLGVSLYYTDAQRRATIILIHGADTETREMGFIVPYFVLHGINVISYDQRGSGVSTGNWLQSSPAQRAIDVDAVIDAFSPNKLVDSKRIGVWGFSNGGWTAPIVATQRPIAFMILKSASAESVQDNLLYEVTQHMLRYHESRAATTEALTTWKALLGALMGSENWAAANRHFAFAKAQPWFSHSLLDNIQLPMSSSVAQGWRNFISYDPAATLRRVTVPTLALYGENDRSVDVHHAAPTIEAAFRIAGMSDFIMHKFPGAGHNLKRSKDGFVSDVPTRLPAGYPDIMLAWLQRRGFLTPAQGAR